MYKKRIQQLLFDRYTVDHHFFLVCRKKSLLDCLYKIQFDIIDLLSFTSRKGKILLEMNSILMRFLLVYKVSELEKFSKILESLKNGFLNIAEQKKNCILTQKM